MAEHADDESPPDSRNRVQPLLDCIAYLLAKRWLRDQQEQDGKPSPEDTETAFKEEP